MSLRGGLQPDEAIPFCVTNTFSVEPKGIASSLSVNLNEPRNDTYERLANFQLIILRPLDNPLLQTFAMIRIEIEWSAVKLSPINNANESAACIPGQRDID